MFIGRLVFSQVMDFMPLPVFRRCVAKYQGDFKVRKFSCLDQYLCMAFAQITYRESLRDTVTCLRSQSNKLYHMGRVPIPVKSATQSIGKRPVIPEEAGHLFQ